MSSPAKIHVPFHLVPRAHGGFAVHWLQQPVLEFPEPGMVAKVGEGALRHFPAADILRWGAPFALAERGLILLHAACTAREGGAIALMAPGGTGKSSLGHALHDAGWTTVADDALLCTVDGRVGPRAEAILKAWCKVHAPHVARSGEVDFESLAGQLHALVAGPMESWQQLDAIAFLRLPRAGNGRFVTERLTAVAGFHELVQHSFGTAPGNVAWTHEARVYQGLASAVALWSVRAPDGLEAMRRALPDWLLELSDAPPPGHLDARTLRTSAH